MSRGAQTVSQLYVHSAFARPFMLRLHCLTQDAAATDNASPLCKARGPIWVGTALAWAYSCGLDVLGLGLTAQHRNAYLLLSCLACTSIVAQLDTVLVQVLTHLALLGSFCAPCSRTAQTK